MDVEYVSGEAYNSYYFLLLLKAIALIFATDNYFFLYATKRTVEPPAVYDEDSGF
jgi:hypothetical protein